MSDRQRSFNSHSGPGPLALVGVLPGLLFWAAISLYPQVSVAQSSIALPNAPLAAKLTTKLASKTAKKKKTTVEWRMRVSGNQWENKEERTQYAGLLLDAKLDQVVSEGLLMHAWAFTSLKSSYAQSRFGEMEGKNSFGVFEAYVQAQPVNVLTFRAGILDQGKWDIPLVVDMLPFPGVLEQIKFGKEYSIQLSAQQSIPTSSTLSTKATESEPTPAFLIETLQVAAEPVDAVIHASAYAGHWSYQGLPEKVAKSSDGYGNTLMIGNDGKTRFRYEFDGWIAGGDLKLNFTRDLSLGFNGQMAQNTRAPETYRNAQQAGTSLVARLPGGIEITPSYNVFFAESDIAPAAYTQTETGHNNRVGWFASLAAKFSKQGVKAAIDYFDADTINPSPVQSRQQFLILRFETLYGTL